MEGVSKSTGLDREELACEEIACEELACDDGGAVCEGVEGLRLLGDNYIKFRGGGGGGKMWPSGTG